MLKVYFIIKASLTYLKILCCKKRIIQRKIVWHPTAEYLCVCIIYATQPIFPLSVPYFFPLFSIELLHDIIVIYTFILFLLLHFTFSFFSTFSKIHFRVTISKVPWDLNTEFLQGLLFIPINFYSRVRRFHFRFLIIYT